MAIVPPPAAIKHRAWIVLFACLQTMLVAGIIFGWASIEGPGSFLTASSDLGGAGLTAVEATQIFSTACSISLLSPLILGAILDKWGPRTCSVLSNIIVLCGCHTCARSNNSRGYAWGTYFMAFGGPGIEASVVHLANLYPSNQQFLIMSTIGGSISLSFIVSPCLDFLYQEYKGVTVSLLFGSYQFVILTSLVGSLLLWPDKPYKHPSNIDNHADNDLEHHHHYKMEEAHPFGLEVELDENDDGSNSLSNPPKDFCRQLTSLTYLRMLLVFLVTCFYTNFYVAALAVELAEQDDVLSIDDQRQVARSFSWINSFGLFASALVGFLMDRIGIVTCTVLTLFMGILQQVLVLLSMDASSKAMVTMTSFVCYACFRQFLYPVFIGSISSRLGFHYFGTLLGIGFAAAGMLQLLIAPLIGLLQASCSSAHESDTTTDCTHGSWQAFHLVTLLVLLLLLVVPALDHASDQTYQEQCKIRREAANQVPSSSYDAISTSEDEPGCGSGVSLHSYKSFNK